MPVCAAIKWWLLLCSRDGIARVCTGVGVAMPRLVTLSHMVFSRPRDWKAGLVAIVLAVHCAVGRLIGK